jgi:hypothetical protein
MLRSCVVVLALCLCFAAVGQQAPDPALAVSSDEYDVFGAAIDFFAQTNVSAHPLVADHTSTFECSSGCNGLSMAGCNGLRGGNEESPSERLKIVKDDLPDLESTTILDFKTKNRSCVELADKIPAKSKYFLLNLDHAAKLPPGWEIPDFFYLSRVAFNTRHSQALVHVSFMSGSDAKYSGGKYFLFIKTEQGWKLKGTSAVWQLVP